MTPYRTARTGAALLAELIQHFRSRLPAHRWLLEYPTSWGQMSEECASPGPWAMGGHWGCCRGAMDHSNTTIPSANVNMVRLTQEQSGFTSMATPRWKRRVRRRATANRRRLGRPYVGRHQGLLSSARSWRRTKQINQRSSGWCLLCRQNNLGGHGWCDLAIMRRSM